MIIQKQKQVPIIIFFFLYIYFLFIYLETVLKPNRGRTEALGAAKQRCCLVAHVATPLMFGRLSRMTPNGALRCRYRPSCQESL